MNAMLVLLGVAALSVSVRGDGLQRYPWRTDLAEARESAAAERKPMLIVFRCEP